MCGRVTLEFDIDMVKEMLLNEFHIDKAHIHEFTPSYNIGPGQSLIAMIKEGESYKSGLIKWGFLPSWAKEANKIMINARSETIHEKVSFKEAYKKRRCVIFASSFYEWDNVGGSRQPYRFMKKEGGLMAFAGIWEKNSHVKEAPYFGCAIVTTRANETMKRIHHRMPVILNKEQIYQWLDLSFGETEALFDMSAYPLKVYPVSTLVNNIRNDGPECIEQMAI